jgi:hypothetical protein
MANGIRGNQYMSIDEGRGGTRVLARIGPKEYVLADNKALR